jgi:DNA processing protein
MLNNLLHTLALLKTEGIGDTLAKKLIHHFGSSENIFLAKKTELLAVEGIGEILIKNLQNKQNFLLAEAELKFIEKEKISTTLYTDAAYPEYLKHCNDGPVVLFQSGNINLDNQKLISIVGTRQITTAGTQFTKKLIEDLAPLNPIIVSGFAYGVDIIAHQTAIDCGLQTIGVLAHGLNQIYPKNHKKFVTKVEENGGFLTEFWSTSNPDRENFLKRNRIVAGMCQATVVVESAEKGGSLNTAQLANSYNREVFAVPGRTTDKYSQGCNNLIKTQRAHLLTNAADVVYMLNWDLGQDASKSRKAEKPIQKQLFVNLNAEEQMIFDYLEKTGKEMMDIIAHDCNLPIFKISTHLLNMELQGVIRPLPGKFFEVI